MNNEQAKTPQFKVGDEVQIRNPHHDWDNGMKKISKVLVERARYVLADDSHETSWPESALKPYTLASEPTPWTLPPPPAGMKWHREDWEEAELPQGWRPLLDGELPQRGDLNGDKDSWAPRTCEFDVPVTSQKDGSGYIFAKHKTPRPLPQSAEPVAEEKPSGWKFHKDDSPEGGHYTAPWDNGKGQGQSYKEPVVEDDEKPSLELMTASRNEYYEMYAAQRSYVMGLESERDQLRKELEEARQRLTERTNALAFAGVREIRHEREIESLTTENAALKEKLDRWQAVGNSVMKAVTGKEGPLSDSDVEAELTRLRSQFRWTPISERLPTEKDGQNQGPFKHEVLWADGEMSWTGGLSDADGTHWMPLPPIPSPPETEEQAMRREFEEWIDSDESPSMDRAEKEIAWLAFQAAKQSTGGQA